MQQHPHYAQVATRMGATVQNLADRNGTCAQLISRRIAGVPFHWLPRGPVWADDTGQTTRAHFLSTLPRRSTHSGIWVGVPNTQMDTSLYQTAGFFPILTPQSVAEIDLTQPNPDRLAAQHGKWRNRLRHALDSTLTYDHRPVCPRRDGPLLDLELAQRRARRYRALPKDFLTHWADAAPQDTRIFLAFEAGRPVAFMVFLLHFPVATYHAGWTGPNGRRHSAHNALVWQASNWLADRGFARLDLGSVDTENAPGLARFKIASGAHLRCLGPTMLRLPGLRWRTTRR